MDIGHTQDFVKEHIMYTKICYARDLIFAKGFKSIQAKRKVYKSSISKYTSTKSTEIFQSLHILHNQKYKVSSSAATNCFIVFPLITDNYPKITPAYPQYLMVNFTFHKYFFMSHNLENTSNFYFSLLIAI